MIKYICDFCHQEIGPNSPFLAFAKPTANNKPERKVEFKADLCDECYQKLLSLFKFESGREEEEVEKSEDTLHVVARGCADIYNAILHEDIVRNKS